MQPPSSNSSSPLWQTISHSVLLRYLLLFACGWATVLLINYFQATIAVFTAAGLLAALLNYPVVWLHRYMPRWLAITIVFLGAIAFILGLVALFGLEVLNQGQSLAGRIAEAITRQGISPIEALLEQFEFDRILEAVRTGLISGLAIAQQFFSSIFVILFGLVISLYMLIDGEKLWHLSLKIVPSDFREKFGYTFQQSFLGFLRGQVILMVYFTVTTLLVLLVLGVDFALLLGLTAGLLDAIPGIGAVVAVVLVTLLAATSQGWMTGLKVLIAMLVIEQLQENYVRPKVMGDELEINPVLLFLALFIGQRIAGLLGVFLAIPIAGMIAAWMRSPDEAVLPEETSEKLEPSSNEMIEYSEKP